jgi:hypothetical protein
LSFPACAEASAGRQNMIRADLSFRFKDTTP